MMHHFGYLNYLFSTNTMPPVDYQEPGTERTKVSKIIKEIPNWKKKCFREGCNNLRNGNQLYCSAECCKLDKQKKR